MAPYGGPVICGILGGAAGSIVGYWGALLYSQYQNEITKVRNQPVINELSEPIGQAAEKVCRVTAGVGEKAVNAVYGLFVNPGVLSRNSSCKSP